MNCPICHATDGKNSRTNVLETQPEARDEGVRVRRRRQCADCGHRFTTFETPQAGTIRKRSGRVEPFDDNKLLESLQTAGEGLDVDIVDLQTIVKNVRAAMEARSGTVDVQDVFRWTMEKLRSYPELREHFRDNMGDLGEARGRTSGWVVKRSHDGEDGQIVVFNRQKLLTALSVAGHRRVSEEDLQRLVDKIEERVASESNPVPTSEIRDWVADELKELDPFAYLRVLSTAPNVSLKSLRKQLVAIEHGWVRKRDGRLEPFSHKKLTTSIQKSTFKRESVSREEISKFVIDVGDRVSEKGDPVETTQLVDWVLEWLKGSDEVVFMSYLLAFRPPEGPGSLDRALKDLER